MVTTNSYYNIFGKIPSGFFNLLSSGSNQEVYSECLILIYEQFEREISYRMDRRRIRDVLSMRLYELQISLTFEEEEAKDYSDLANAIIRKMCSKNIGWLEEETDDTTLEKAVYMTENGLALAEFLLSVQKPEKEEYSAYIIEIRNILLNPDLWKEHPYIHGIKRINTQARALSKSLKKLSTYIRKIIERMILEESFESLTDNLIEYFDGGFVKEYARLTKEQNVYRYRGIIRTELEKIRKKTQLMDRIVQECILEENLTEEDAKELVEELLLSINRFLFEDYERIMKDIKHKINVYLQVGIGRARFLRNREIDERSYVERTIRMISQEYKELSNKDLLPLELSALFTFERHELIDPSSIRFPGKERIISKVTHQKMEELTEKDLAEAKKQQEWEAFNPYSKDKMKQFFLSCMDGRREIVSEQLPLSGKNELLATLSGVAYAEDNHFSVEVLDGYVETQGLLLRRFRIRNED